jgi:predicted Rossmann fold nucleotide-binding protein DprA/Smf involved in DNA uptake
MDFQPLAIDVMVAKSGIAAEQLAATLIQLELKNIVRIEAGGYALIPTAMRADT